MAQLATASETGVSIQNRWRRDVTPDAIVEAALIALRHQDWNPASMSERRTRRIRRRVRVIKASDVRYSIYLPPLGSIARQLLGAREIKLR